MKIEWLFQRYEQTMKLKDDHLNAIFSFTTNSSSMMLTFLDTLNFNSQMGKILCKIELDGDSSRFAPSMALLIDKSLMPLKNACSPNFHHKLSTLMITTAKKKVLLSSNNI